MSHNENSGGDKNLPENVAGSLVVAQTHARKKILYG
jgi:hypothetical protein